MILPDSSNIMPHHLSWQIYVFASNHNMKWRIWSKQDQFDYHLLAPHSLFSSILPLNSLWSTRVQIWLSKATLPTHHRRDETADSSQQLSGQSLQSDAAVCMQSKRGHAYYISKHKIIEFCAKNATKCELHSTPLRETFPSIVKSLAYGTTAVQKLLLSSVLARLFYTGSVSSASASSPLKSIEQLCDAELGWITCGKQQFAQCSICHDP